MTSNNRPNGDEKQMTVSASYSNCSDEGKLSSPRTDNWIMSRRAREDRRDGRALLVATVAALLLQILLAFQFAVGALRHFSFSDTVVTVLLLSIVLTVISSLIAPVWTSKLLGKILRIFGERIFAGLTIIILGGFYILILPFGAVWGKRSFLQRHKASGAWVGLGDWKRQTWAPKQSEADVANRKARTTSLKALKFFAEQKNWFLFVVATFLILIASFIAFANSPVVAPFIYTLF